MTATAPNPITTPFLLLLALFAWTSRHGTALGWYRGCGWEPSNMRGPLHDVSTATIGEGDEKAK